MSRNSRRSGALLPLFLTAGRVIEAQVWFLYRWKFIGVGRPGGRGGATRCSGRDQAGPAINFGSRRDPPQRCVGTAAGTRPTTERRDAGHKRTGRRGDPPRIGRASRSGRRRESSVGTALRRHVGHRRRVAIPRPVVRARRASSVPLLNDCCAIDQGRDRELSNTSTIMGTSDRTTEWPKSWSRRWKNAVRDRDNDEDNTEGTAPERVSVPWPTAVRKRWRCRLERKAEPSAIATGTRTADGKYSVQQVQHEELREGADGYRVSTRGALLKPCDQEDRLDREQDGWEGAAARRPKASRTSRRASLAPRRTAQLVRAPACHAGGHGFESRRSRSGNPRYSAKFSLQPRDLAFRSTPIQRPFNARYERKAGAESLSESWARWP